MINTLPLKKASIKSLYKKAPVKKTVSKKLVSKKPLPWDNPPMAAYDFVELALFC